MRKSNLPRLAIGAEVIVATYMIGRRGSHYHGGNGGYLCGLVRHVTPKGGILVQVYDSDRNPVGDGPQWFPYHAVRVAGSPDGEPHGPRVRKVEATM
jgi:hypothetical protein